MKFTSTFKKLILVGLFSTLIVSCSDDDDSGDDKNIMEAPAELGEANVETRSIVEIAASDERFSTLVTALQAADLVETLKGDGPFTVFAPLNDAFGKIDPDALEALLKDKTALSNVLLYHVVSGAAVPQVEAVKLSEAEMASGESITLEVKNGELILNGNSKVIIADIQASNGVIHVIDTVLLPAS